MTLHLFVRIATGGNTDEIGRALAECGPRSRAEAGCLEYRTFRSAEGDALLLKEEWRDQAALDEHMETPHFVAFKRAVEQATGGGMDKVSQVWEAAPLEL